jgi:hypothetical protein
MEKINKDLVFNEILILPQDSILLYYQSSNVV